MNKLNKPSIKTSRNNLKKIKKLLLVNFRKQNTLPFVSCDCCNKSFKLGTNQAMKIRRDLITLVFCGKKCQTKHKMFLFNNKICSVKACCKGNAKIHNSLRTGRKIPSLMCNLHWNKKKESTQKGRIDDDMYGRFLVAPLIPLNILNETERLREEWFKLIVNDLCQRNYIRKNNEQYCGLENGKTRGAIQEDIYFIDLNLLVSLKRSHATTNKDYTKRQLDLSRARFEESWGYKCRYLSASISNEKNVATMDIIEFLKYLLNDLIKFFKKGKLKLPIGITMLKKSFNDVIDTLVKRKLQYLTK